MGDIVVIGDTLLDCDIYADPSRLMGDAPAMIVSELDRSVRAGGAGLAATMLAADGHDVRLVTALADDSSGWLLRSLLEGDGIDVIDVGADGHTSEKIRIFAHGRPVLRLDRGGPEARRLNANARAAIEAADAVLVSDYGLGITSDLWARQSILDAVAGGTPVVWDPHLEGAPPVAGTTIATPNLDEVRGLTGADLQDDTKAIARAARQLQAAWTCEHVCVTMGANGSLTIVGDGAAIFTSAARTDGDPCGAGDRFAAELAAQLALGVPMRDALQIAAQTAADFVGSQPTGGPVAAPRRVVAGRGRGRADRSSTDADVDAWRAAIRTVDSGALVVATSGCFDLLHAGHVSMLRAARELGDYLVVLLNSDRSVRALKGRSRPVVPAKGRADVLRALSCVDCVIEFDEDTPSEALRKLRPGIFAKGGDYRAQTLPEHAVMTELGGEVVILPTFGTTSTTSLIERFTAVRGAADAAD
jgi:rfaE bifunctional protein nucleotidyltransferase chain/domain/rfaE bifunctional protein kinase chain/domain